MLRRFRIEVHPIFFASLDRIAKFAPAAPKIENRTVFLYEALKKALAEYIPDLCPILLQPREPQFIFQGKLLFGLTFHASRESSDPFSENFARHYSRTEKWSSARRAAAPKCSIGFQPVSGRSGPCPLGWVPTQRIVVFFDTRRSEQNDRLEAYPTLLSVESKDDLRTRHWRSPSSP
jgi:hypothetical protein